MIIDAEQGNNWTFAQLMVYIILLLVASLSVLGLVQLATYLWSCWKAVRTILAHRGQEPDTQPVATADVGIGDIGGIEEVQADADGGGSSAASTSVASTGDGLRLRTPGQQRKLIGVTEVNTIRRENGRLRIFEKKLHALSNCRGLTQEPLVCILEVSISGENLYDAGLCRLCHPRRY